MSNDNCYDNNCVKDCCNYYGYCPEDYSSIYYGSEYTECHYYYSDTTMNGGSIAGIVVGIACFVFIFVVILLAVRRCFQRNNMAPSGQNGNGN